ncbi:hypothetical protein KIH39_19060 [Telmatocola sphagniphila]|uniref:Uncharacterized protein n=1 Tax=Telmatocola sphagniphila TaxID=1123043 RepID=A0A8E6B4F8_9BACT|nr:hypothetical protein [Telmatocola sphagniphila]QVL30936.1 hypothetical protein KIH39_19060 [Telmatocola sphagniphila]
MSTAPIPIPYPETTAIYRPFGSPTPIATEISGHLIADSSGLNSTRTLKWTHILETASSTDLRDGCSRTAGTNAIVYADGDEVRMGGNRFVVVWVEIVNPGSSFERKRAYLMRHS